MKVIFALRRGVFYPHQTDAFGALPPKEMRGPYLKKLRDIGFEGIEVGMDAFQGGEAASRELAKELADAGLPIVAVRAGGGFTSPRAVPENARRLNGAIKAADMVGASVINTALVCPPADPGGPGLATGEPVSQGSSRLAKEDDFVRTALVFQEAGEAAANLGMEISIEVHQRSIADNSWATLHLLELIERQNVGCNPDLGNVYWTYDVPEETSEAAIIALAPRAKYWHCKNLMRVYVPETKHAVFLQTALPDGDIDYRFAITAMLTAGYEGYLAIEGTRTGDSLSKDTRSVEYVRGLLRELGVSAD